MFAPNPDNNTEPTPEDNADAPLQAPRVPDELREFWRRMAEESTRYAGKTPEPPDPEAKTEDSLKHITIRFV